MHYERQADVTVGCIEVPRMEATGFGVMAVDSEDRIVSFLEKPKDPPGMPDKPDMALASMGIYVFATKFLFDQLRRDAADPNSSRDFGKDLIPYLVKHGKAIAHRFSDSCVRSGFEAERVLARCRHAGRLLAGEHRPDRDGPRARSLRPASGRSGPMARSRRRRSSCTTSTAGAARRSARWYPAAASSRALARALVAVHRRAHAFLRQDGEQRRDADVDIGRGARLRNVIIDRGVRIPEGLVVGEDPLADAERFRRTEQGICLITQPMLDRLR